MCICEVAIIARTIKLLYAQVIYATINHFIGTCLHQHLTMNLKIPIQFIVYKMLSSYIHTFVVT